jgi:hypothetical protein
VGIQGRQGRVTREMETETEDDRGRDRTRQGKARQDKTQRPQGKTRHPLQSANCLS